MRISFTGTLDETVQIGRIYIDESFGVIDKHPAAAPGFLGFLLDDTHYSIRLDTAAQTATDPDVSVVAYLTIRIGRTRGKRFQ